MTQDIGYNAAGQVTGVADWRGDTTSYQYDSLGRQTETDYPGGGWATTGYDPLGDVTSTKQYDTSNNLLASTSAAFNGEGQQLSATDADGNGHQFSALMAVSVSRPKLASPRPGASSCRSTVPRCRCRCRPGP